MKFGMIYLFIVTLSTESVGTAILIVATLLVFNSFFTLVYSNLIFV